MVNLELSFIYNLTLALLFSIKNVVAFFFQLMVDKRDCSISVKKQSSFHKPFFIYLTKVGGTNE